MYGFSFLSIIRNYTIIEINMSSMKLNQFNYDLWDRTKNNGKEFIPGPRGNTKSTYINKKIYREQRIASALKRAVCCEPLCKFEDNYNVKQWKQTAMEFENDPYRYPSNYTVKFAFMDGEPYKEEVRSTEFLVAKCDVKTLSFKFGENQIRMINIGKMQKKENFNIPLVNLKVVAGLARAAFYNMMQYHTTGIRLKTEVLKDKPEMDTFGDFYESCKDDFKKVIPEKDQEYQLELLKKTCQQEIQFRIEGDENDPEPLHFAVYANFHARLPGKIEIVANVVNPGWNKHEFDPLNF